MRQGKGTAGKVRIIGGQWRGSVLPVPERPGLRPSADRCRETLFNWLQGEVAGAHCLDLFAGTGALGLEALSRGAASCTFIERDRVAARALRESIARLQAPAAMVVESDANAWLRAAPQRPWDLVFIDPPFASDQLDAVCTALVENGHVAAGSVVYLEQPVNDAVSAIPHAQLRKQASSREACYSLFDVIESDLADRTQ